MTARRCSSSCTWPSGSGTRELKARRQHGGLWGLMPAIAGMTSQGSLRPGDPGAPRRGSGGPGGVELGLLLAELGGRGVAVEPLARDPVEVVTRVELGD